ncbi:uncharacterized protein LOC101857145 isoform X2 [Aplysia californica]|uniref:Uncharacterized protein LOC101857145 isoform X2 n=1 Tax=Aplysia californica TaxID=6500 RepID=A0ABM0K4B1_APLCA|nr:uncharacterized protein LOC101857145 isoform X2 [Aplysia californica]
MATRIPINKDNYNFEDRQKKIWEDMEKDMERRRSEWESEIDKMRKEFFLLNPERTDFHSVESTPSSRLPARIAEADDGKPVIEKDENGHPVFKVRFNMRDYSPEEINVKMDTTKIMVSARHEEKGGGSSVSREYNREVNIPRDVDPLALSCTLNPDGYLVVHAPLPTPSYHAIKDSTGATHSPPGVVKSSSSYQTSSSSTLPKGASLSNQIPPPMYSPRDQQQQQQQTRVHTINQQPPMSSIKQPNAFAQSSLFNQSDSMEHPDHVVPSYKPPVDLSKFDSMMEDHGPRLTPQFQSSQLHSAPASHLSGSSTLPKSSPFGSLSSTFPTGPISSQAQLSTPMVTSQEGKFQLTMPIDDYKPEELTVKTQDGKVIICAKRQITSGNRNQTSEMSREHSLPDNVDPLTVKAFFTDTNNLIVEAPFKR